MRLLYTTLLPIELLKFNAEYNKDIGAVALNWATASETNNACFTVERSIDGETFAGVETQKGAGNSTETRYYSAVDDDILGGVVYYRLKQTDFDGNYSYSNIVSVNETNVPRVTVYPNPATSMLNINCHASCLNETEQIEIIDCTGRLAIEKNVVSNASGDNTYSVDISSLSKGLYMVKVITPTKAFFNKFIKQ